MFTTLTRHLRPVVLAVAVFATPALADQPTRDSRPLGPARTAEAGDDATRPATPKQSTGTLRTAASLAAVLGLIFGGAAIYRKFAGRNQSLAGSMGVAGKSPAGIMEIVGRYPVGRGNTLVLLRLDKRILLLSQTVGSSGRGLIRPGSASLNTLCEITSADDVASILAKATDAEGESMTARFQSLLSGYSAESDAPTESRDSEHVAADSDDRPTVVVRTGSWSASRGGAA